MHRRRTSIVVALASVIVTVGAALVLHTGSRKPSTTPPEPALNVASVGPATTPLDSAVPASAAATRAAVAGVNRPGSGWKLMGRLVNDPGGTPACGVEVVLSKLDDAHATQVEAGRVVSSADGAFQFEALLRGEYAIDTGGPDVFLGMTAPPIVLDDDSGVRDLGYIGVFHGGRVVAVVRGPDGLPKSDAPVTIAPEVVRAASPTAMAWHGRHIVIHSSVEGRVEIGGIPAGTILLRARHDEFCDADPVRVDVREGDTSTAPDLVLKLGGALALRVIDEQGQAVPLPVIRLTGNPRRVGLDPTPSSEPDGTWRSRALEPGSWTVEIRHPDFLPRVLDGLPIVAGETLRRDVVLARGLEVSGSVVDRDGKPVARARVEYDATASTTDAAGCFRVAALAPGSGALVASQDRFASATLDDVAAGSSGLRLMLGPGTFITGKLMTARRSLAPKRVTIFVFHEGEPRVESARLHDGLDGAFTLAVAPGVSTTVRFVAAGHAPATVGPFLLAARESREGIDVDLEPGVSVTGRVVVKANDAPLPFVAVGIEVPRHDRLEASDESDDWGSGVTVVTASDGSFRAAGVPASSRSPIRVSVKNPNYLPTERIVGADERANAIVLRLSNGGIVRGHAPPRGDESFNVAITRFADESLGTSQTHAGICRVLLDGSWEVRGLSPGRYAATLQKGARRLASSPVERRLFEIAGEEVVTIDFDTATALKVSVRGRLLREGRGVPGANLSVSKREEPFTRTRLGGEFLLAPLPPGEQTLVVKDSTNELGFTVRIVVPDALEATQDIVYPSESLEVRVRAAEDGAPIPGAYVRVEASDEPLDCWCHGTTGASGTFVSKNVQARNYSIVAGKGRSYRDPESRLERIVSVDVHAGEANVVEIELARRASGSIRGTVRLPDGSAARDAFVRIKGEGIVVAGVSPAADARYASGSMPEGEYDLDVTADGWATIHRHRVHVGSQASTTLDFTLARGGSIRVRLSPTSSRRAGGQWILGEHLNTGDARSGDVQAFDIRTQSDGDGEVVLEHLEPGEYLIQADVEGAPSSTITVRDGETTSLTLPMP